MPKKPLIPSDLSPEQLQDLSQQDWRFIEAKTRKVLKGLIRSSTSKSINTKELVEVMRSAATAKEHAYPDADRSALNLHVPASLLKSVELAIKAQSIKSGIEKDTVIDESIMVSPTSEPYV